MHDGCKSHSLEGMFLLYHFLHQTFWAHEYLSLKLRLKLEYGKDAPRTKRKLKMTVLGSTREEHAPLID